MNLIDLHTHTTCSDGTYTPTELIEYAAQKKLRAIAITDHDTVSALGEAAKTAENYGIELIPGVEISAIYEGFEIHILGYFIDINHKPLLNFLSDCRNMRHNRNLEVIRLLCKENIPVTLKEIEALSGGEVIGRAHFAKFLVNNSYCLSVKEAFANYLLKGQKAYAPRVLPKYEEAIEIIQLSGGIPVLAHPVKYRLDHEGGDLMVKALKSRGLMGLEALYSDNTQENEARYKSMAEKYSLIITGGSDFHGLNKPGLDLGSGYGSLAIDYSILDNLKNAKNSMQ